MFLGFVPTWFSVVDVEVEDSNAAEGDEGGDPVHEEHDGHAEESAQKRNPHAVVLQR